MGQKEEIISKYHGNEKDHVSWPWLLIMKTKAYFYIISAAALWGLIGLFVKHLASLGFTSIQIVALRSISSAICAVLALAPSVKALFKIDWRDAWMFIGTGVISLTFFNYCYFNCIAASSLAVAALLLYTAPIFVMIMSVFLFRESFTAKKAAALIMTFAGCGCVTGAFSGSLSLTFTGLLYGLGSGFGYALYSIFGKYAVEKYSSATITIYTFFFASVAAIPIANFPADTLARINTEAIANVLGLGLICAVIPYLLYNKGLLYVDPGQASILATIEPFVAAVIGICYFQEPLTAQKLVGMGLIFAAIILLNLPVRNLKLTK